MKSLKKILFVVALFSVALLFTGCGNSNIYGDLGDLMDKVYAEIPEDERPMMLQQVEVNADNIEYYLGTSDISYKEALASEPAIGSIAHSVVLIRVADDASVEDVKTKIKENVNPRKWVCVGVEAEDVIVKNRGNLIILILEDDQTTREALEKGYLLRRKE